MNSSCYMTNHRCGVGSCVCACRQCAIAIVQISATELPIGINAAVSASRASDIDIDKDMDSSDHAPLSLPINKDQIIDQVNALVSFQANSGVVVTADNIIKNNNSTFSYNNSTELTSSFNTSTINEQVSLETDVIKNSLKTHGNIKHKHHFFA